MAGKGWQERGGRKGVAGNTGKRETRVLVEIEKKEGDLGRGCYVGSNR